MVVFLLNSKKSIANRPIFTEFYVIIKVIKLIFSFCISRTMSEVKFNVIKPQGCALHILSAPIIIIILSEHANVA